MSFTRIRRLLFQLHMWIGLGLGLLLVLLGLSGSILVYDEDIQAWMLPVPHAVADTVSTVTAFGAVEVPAHPSSRLAAVRMTAYLAAREATLRR